MLYDITVVEFLYVILTFIKIQWTLNKILKVLQKWTQNVSEQIHLTIIMKINIYLMDSP